MSKMTAERAAKILAEDGVFVTIEEAAIVVEFLRTLAKVAVAQYLREEEEPLNTTEGDNTTTTI
ncbi:hypothetical protein ACQ86N_10855 [Puia sp. P3]|uniref:hypothetical protein n=1 Tax=Puia sp. P3 TaxID=3423952 RepID=UPI003D671712